MELTLLKLDFDETALLLMAPDDAWARKSGACFVSCVSPV